MRGKLLGQSVLPDQRRITPAGAGKTRRQPKNCHLRQDHPRRCGENHVEKNKKLQQLGSPPQVRGKPAEIRHRRHSRRITPAGAGKTFCRRLRRACTRDHPRRCGENSNGRRVSNSITGSPPQVRGKLQRHRSSSPRQGITPAGAGKTHSRESQPSRPTDHPRRCGENHTALTMLQQQPGSPPQVRGKPTETCGKAAGDGITPAGAGKTELDIVIAVAVEDHPRRCGENRKRIACKSYVPGSPPQVRGKPSSRPYWLDSARITPAGAGKTV